MSTKHWLILRQNFKLKTTRFILPKIFRWEDQLELFKPRQLMNNMLLHAIYRLTLRVQVIKHFMTNTDVKYSFVLVKVCLSFFAKKFNFWFTSILPAQSSWPLKALCSKKTHQQRNKRGNAKLYNKAVFIWMLKAISSCFGFTLLRAVIV